MTPEQRALEFVEVGFESLGVPLEPYVQIIAELIVGAEADLRAEVERLTAEIRTVRNTAKINLKVAQDRKVEIERLTAQNKELCDAMLQCAHIFETVARAALESKL